jgi:hypothetical protein
LWTRFLVRLCLCLTHTRESSYLFKHLSVGQYCVFCSLLSSVSLHHNTSCLISPCIYF